MDALFGHNSLAYCVTTCTSAGDWDGINTIQNNFWNTNCVAVDGDDDTVNPILAWYPYYSTYRIDVLCYSLDEDCTFGTI